MTPITKLPLTLTFTTAFTANSAVAHALEFDLVAVEATEEKALGKLRIMVELYIKHGVDRGWQDQLQFPAPQKYWDDLNEMDTVDRLSPIEADNQKLTVFRAMLANQA